MNRRLWMTLSLVLITLALVVGASIPATAYTPTIYSVTPSNGATGVSVNAEITIKWSGTSESDFFPVLVKATGGPYINLLTFRLTVEHTYDPYGHVISSFYTSYCYPVDASNNRISLELHTQYKVVMRYRYSPYDEHAISSFTTGSQSTPTWSGWTSLGGQLLAGTGPAAYSSGSATGWFVTGTNHQLYWSTGSSWVNLGGYLTSSPAAVSSASGVIDVFGRGSNGALYTRHYSGGAWGVWTNRGGQLAPNTGPAVSSRGAGRLDVFVTGTNHALYHMMLDSAGWHAWESLGGQLSSSPAATSENLYVCARGSNGALYRINYNNGWQPWMSLGGQIAPNTGPAASSWPGRIDVFVKGTDGALYHKWWDAGWGYSGWASLGGYLTSSPAATSPAQGRVDVFVRGGDGALWWKYCQSV